MLLPLLPMIPPPLLQILRETAADVLTAKALERKRVSTAPPTAVFVA
jgi:hypothetical protein